MREPSEYEVTIEHLIKLVHAYTDPIRIHVVIDNRFKFDEAKNMRDFDLVKRLFKGSRQSEKEMDRLMKYYKDVPVWNLTVWVDGTYYTDKGRTISMGINANCHYSDIREGWLAEQNDIRREKRREYRRRKKAESEDKA